MQLRRKGVEGVCVWQVCEDHPALVWSRVHILQNILRICLTHRSPKSKLTRKEMDLPAWSPSQERVQCAQHPGDPGGLSLRFPKQIGKTVNSANAVLRHRDKSCCNLVWHPHCFPVPASRTGSECQYDNSHSDTIDPPTAIAQCQGCAVGCKHRNTLSKRQEIKLIFGCRRFAESAKRTKHMSGGLQYRSPLAGTALEQ